MKKNNLLMTFIFGLLLTLLTACSGSKNAAATKNIDPDTSAGNTVTNTQAHISLASYLRQVSGVTVRGNGDNAQVYIRGMTNSQAAVSEPMFVLDGVPVGTSYAQVTNLVDVNDIDKVTVLKGSDAMMEYGMQGANGVIEIKTKGGN